MGNCQNTSNKDVDLYFASQRGDLTEVKRLLDSGAEVNYEYGVYYIILYYTVMCTVVIDIIIIYYSMEIHLLL
jgi:hypothetical protein